MAAALFLGQDVHLARELGVRVDGLGLRQHLPALNLIALHAAQQHADVVAGNGLVQHLAEHLHARHHDGARLGRQTHDLHRVLHLDRAALHAARRHRAAAGDREHVLDRHQERQVGRTLRRRNVGVHFLHQFKDALALRRGFGISAVLHGFQRLQGRALDDRNVVARELILVEQLADLHLNQLQQLLIVHLIGLVHEHDDVRHADLTGQQDVLARLRHGAVRRRHHQDGAVHLRRARDHVLDIVGVSGAVHMRVVAGIRLILHMRGVDRDSTLPLFRRFINLVVLGRRGQSLRRQAHRDRRRQRRLAMVHVADGADVNVRLCSFELFLAHLKVLLFNRPAKPHKRRRNANRKWSG